MSRKLTTMSVLGGAAIVLGLMLAERDGGILVSHAQEKKPATTAKPVKEEKAEAKPTAKPETKGESKPDDLQGDRSEDEAGIRASADRFVKAFNEGDAKAAAAQFLPKAEYLNSDGEAFEGREAIEADLADYFKNHPKAHIEMAIDSIRFVGPRVAIEEGRTEVTHDPDAEPVRQSYIAVDLLTDGEWMLGSVRELPEEVEPVTPHDHLQVLAWLEGDWIDESEDGIAETSYRWTEDGNYLISEFHLKIGGLKTLSGQQRIGWDPLTKQIKSWVFDASGGYGEGLWTWDEDHWVAKATGVRADGTAASATNLYTPLSGDAFRFQSTSRIAGDETEPDVNVVVVRRPPSPSKTRIPGEEAASGDEKKPTAAEKKPAAPEKKPVATEKN